MAYLMDALVLECAAACKEANWEVKGCPPGGLATALLGNGCGGISGRLSGAREVYEVKGFETGAGVG